MITEERDVKKTLRRSLEVRYDTKLLIFALVMLLLFEGACIALLVESGRSVEKAKAELESVKAEMDAEDWLTRPFRVEMAKMDLSHAEETQASAIMMSMLTLMLFGSMSGYYGWRLWKTLHAPETYTLYKGRLINPSASFGRNAIHFTAVFTDEHGQTLSRDTRGIFTTWSLDTYNGKPVTVAFDPVDDRLAVIKEED